MAAGFSSKTPGGSRHMSELRVVILGRNEASKIRVVESVLGCKDPEGQSVGHCTLYQGEQDTRRIIVVDTPGWDKTSPENIKEELERSVSLCSPEPHAFLLVIPVKNSEYPTDDEITAAQKHIELLSERVWKHTILLFECNEGMGDFAFKLYFKSGKNIIEKCKGRSYVLESRSKISELFTKIEDLVEENRGNVFIPQAYYELIQRMTQEVSRRGSLDLLPPNMTKAKPDILDVRQALLIHHFKPTAVIIMAVFGALLGAVGGTEHGVSGACVGLFVGSMLAVFLTALVFKVIEHRTD